MQLVATGAKKHRCRVRARKRRQESNSEICHARCASATGGGALDRARAGMWRTAAYESRLSPKRSSLDAFFERLEYRYLLKLLETGSAIFGSIDARKLSMHRGGGMSDLCRVGEHASEARRGGKPEDRRIRRADCEHRDGGERWASCLQQKDIWPDHQRGDGLTRSGELKAG